MFLLTTADERFLRKNGKILLLGEWCKSWERRALWDGIDHEVLPYHWDDRRKLLSDYHYIDGLYENVLKSFATQLNALHQVDHSLRYWRIVLGPWLYVFISILFDRYESIKVASQSGKATNTLIGKYGPSEWILRDNVDFYHNFLWDEYNHFLFSRIIERTKPFPFEEVEIKRLPPQPLHVRMGWKNARNAPAFKNLRINAMQALSRFCPSSLNRIVFISSYLSGKDLAKLQLSMGQLPYIYPPKVPIPNPSVDFSLRRKVHLNLAGNDFETFLGGFLPSQIPRLYLEGYKEMNKVALSYLPEDPKLMFTANAYNQDEAFKFWSAHYVDKGAKLCGTQHGGFCGMLRLFQEEEHQIKIYDRFYTWGWKSDKHDNTVPLAAVKLNKIKNQAKPKRDGNLLLITTAWPKYAYTLFSVPVAASQVLSYFEEQYRFARTLPVEMRKSLIVRPFPVDREWRQVDRWKHEVPDVECNRKMSMADQLSQCRLAITLGSTPQSELFGSNFPTVLFFDPSTHEQSDLAKPYYDDLRRVGILHDTPEAAAAKVVEVYEDTISWWQQPEIQKAKDDFCKEFARTSDNWLDEWKNELVTFAKSGKS